MALTPRLDLRQSQTLVMTPQLQQAIKLLQLSNLDLAAWAATDEAIVASTIGGLVREGIVRRKDRSYFINDYAKLRGLSEV